MTNEEKLQEIYESYIVGQKKQMVKQIKAYGQAKFFVDFHEKLFEDLGGNFHNSFAYDYADMVKAFFLLK